MKVLTIFGTRPEAIKLAPVVRELKARATTTCLHSSVCVTGQHRQMLDQVQSSFELCPDHDLNLMAEGQTPTQVAAAVLERLEPVLSQELPDWVVVQGDTTTAMAASLAAFYARVKVAHVEAGLRTGDRQQPYPEEINRRMTAVLADLHLAPTKNAKHNLLREGIAEESVLVTGNSVIDALQWAATSPPPASAEALPVELRPGGAADRAKLILITAHRRENFGRPLENICLALKDLARQYGPRICIVYPVHLNPNVSGPVHRLLEGTPNITLLPPLDYHSLVHLMKRCHIVLTDSGGLQEEAPSLGRPVLVLRDVTERPEAVEAGTVKVIGTERDPIVDEVRLLLEDSDEYNRMAQAVNPYGDGHAARRIVSALLGEPVDPFINPSIKVNA